VSADIARPPAEATGVSDADVRAVSYRQVARDSNRRRGDLPSGKPTGAPQPAHAHFRRHTRVECPRQGGGPGRGVLGPALRRHRV